MTLRYLSCIFFDFFNAIQETASDCTRKTKYIAKKKALSWEIKNFHIAVTLCGKPRRFVHCRKFKK